MTALDVNALQALVDRTFPDDDFIIAMDQRFEDIGFDSLAVLELGSALEKEFGIPLSEPDLYDCNTFGDLAALISAVSPST
ncbi:MAG: acyl carrier protein [Rhodococcus sp. (in: high G+C Gram-positive bacteria)]|uniref:acyl carrier protein n=1 Tax=unclassified Rhodococcus (in: high G+C Gram-positive bacteria) TaxID=192944 RepID=UPI000ADFE5D1|nr:MULTISPECIES: acyl carrier protein [unclassified Rhodococcus (in: high G+C Gram-positive bacteria)]RMB78133.1 acyl carrier protein [Rhodococcus sp. SBT000017]